MIYKIIRLIPILGIILPKIVMAQMLAGDWICKGLCVYTSPHNSVIVNVYPVEEWSPASQYDAFSLLNQQCFGGILVHNYSSYAVREQHSSHSNSSTHYYQNWYGRSFSIHHSSTSSSHYRYEENHLNLNPASPDKSCYQINGNGPRERNPGVRQIGGIPAQG